MYMFGIHVDDEGVIYVARRRLRRLGRELGSSDETIFAVPLGRPQLWGSLQSWRISDMSYVMIVWVCRTFAHAIKTRLPRTLQIREFDWPEIERLSDRTNHSFRSDMQRGCAWATRDVRSQREAVKTPCNWERNLRKDAKPTGSVLTLNVAAKLLQIQNIADE